VPNGNGSTNFEGLEEALKDQLIGSLKEFTYNKGSLIELNGKKMLKINYLHTMEGFRLNAVQYIYLTKSTFYILSTTTLEGGNVEFSKTAEKIVSTIKEQ
jgi:hypothetical protein